MYSIISNNKMVALCDKPRYVKQNEKTGVYVETTQEEAVAVSVAGKLYNLNGLEMVTGAPFAIVKEIDGAEYVFETAKTADSNAAKMSQIEDVLCDFDNIINGGK